MKTTIGQVELSLKNGVVNFLVQVGDVRVGLLVSRNTRTGVLHLALAADGKTLFDGHVGGQDDAKTS